MNLRRYIALFAALLLAGQILPGYSVCACDRHAMPAACCEAPKTPPPCCASEKAAPVSGPVYAQHGCDRDLTLTDLTAVVPVAPPAPAAPTVVTPWIPAVEPAPVVVVLRVPALEDPSPPGPPVFLLPAALLI